MSFSRGWKHFSRAVAKPFTGANIGNMQELERFILAADVAGYQNVSASVVKHGEFDFSWVQALSPTEYRDFRTEWMATLQEHARSLSVTSGTVVTSAVTPAIRTRLMQERTRTAMWTALQNTKDRFRRLAKSKVEGFFGRQKRKLDEFRTSLEDTVHRNPLFGLYLSYYDAATTSFEHGSTEGAENETQRNLLAAGGLYKVIKSAGSAAQGLVRTIATAGADLSAVKKLVTGGVSALNSLGGLLGGLVDLANGREADWRSLSARFGLDQSVDQLVLRIKGRNQAAIREQVISGPQQLSRGADLTEEDLVALRTQLRHSLYWVKVFEKDIDAIEEELNTTDLQHELNAVMARLQTSEDTGLLKPSQIRTIGTVERAKKGELLRQLAEAKTRVQRFKDFMAGDLRKMDNLMAAVETRRGIAAQQRNAVDAGLQFDAQRVLAHEVSAFDRSRLRHVERTAPTPAAEPEILTQIRTFDRSRLKSARLRELNPAPSTASSSAPDIGAILSRLSSEHSAFLATAADLIPITGPSTSVNDWDTD